jgi:hypothetical protein
MRGLGAVLGQCRGAHRKGAAQSFGLLLQLGRQAIGRGTDDHESIGHAQPDANQARELRGLAADRLVVDLVQGYQARSAGTAAFSVACAA